jgi:hypothetical protein
MPPRPKKPPAEAMTMVFSAWRREVELAKALVSSSKWVASRVFPSFRESAKKHLRVKLFLKIFRHFFFLPKKLSNEAGASRPDDSARLRVANSARGSFDAYLLLELSRPGRLHLRSGFLCRRDQPGAPLFAKPSFTA